MKRTAMQMLQDGMSGKKATKKKRKTAPAIKTTGKFEGKSNKLGGGGRFKQLEAQGKSPALTAFIGRQKYGDSKMQSMAAKGKKNKHARKR